MPPPTTLIYLIISHLEVMSDANSEKYILSKNQVRGDGGNSLLNRVFGALTHQRRRYVLYYLRDYEQTDIDDLACHLVAWEQDTPLDEVSAKDVEHVKMELVHSHLPKLAKYGFIEYDRRSDTVCYTVQPEFLDDALELAATFENSS